MNDSSSAQAAPSGLNLRTFHPPYEYTVGLLGVLINSLLVYLALYKTEKHMKKYSIILCQSCAVDFYYNLLNVMFVVVVEMKGGNLFYFLGGPLEHADPVWVCICWAVYLSGLYGTIVNVPAQFLYRYFTLCRDRELSIPEYLGMFFFGFSFVICHSIIGYFSLYPDPAVLEAHLPMLKADPLWAVNTPTFVVGDRDNVLALVHFLCGLFIINGSYGIVVWTSMKIYKQLKAMRPRMSKETLEAQKQVTKILFIQAAMPFVVLSAPVLVAVVSAMLGINVPMVGPLMAMMVPWLPIVNALSAVVIVPSYRNFVLCRTKAVSAHSSAMPSKTNPSLTATM